MNLRPRLGLTLLITAVPLVAGLVLLRKDVQRKSVEDGLREFAIAHMQTERTDCEAAPTTWGGALHGRPVRPDGKRRPRADGRKGRKGLKDRPPPGRPADGPPQRRAGTQPPRESLWIWAYAPDLRAANPSAPELPPSYVHAAREGADTVGGRFQHKGWDGYEVLVRMAWDTGPCAFVLVRNYGKRIPAVGRELIWAAIVLCGVLLLAVLFAAAPLVRRIRRLEEDVRSAAADRYVRPIEVAGEDEIAGLATAFNEAGAELRTHLETIEDRERSLRHFVANTTHDVMIPLTVLQGDLSRIRKSLDADEPVDRDSVVQALEEAHYMGSLMHNLSAVSKLEGGGYRVQRNPVDLNALVSRAVGRHRPMAEARGIALEFGVPEEALYAIGDVTLMEQAVSNLIHNAVRYNERDGHVAVILETPRGTPERFFLTVVDDGPGIPDEELARLPERRFRGEMARQRHPGGLGLGLHITRDVAARHGFGLDFRRSSYGGLEVELSGSALKA